jgi:hypothetical protein
MQESSRQVTMETFPTWLEWLPDGIESWEALVAIGTIALAGATFYLGWQTRSDVNTSRESVQAAERSDGNERVIYLGNGEWQPLDDTPPNGQARE